MVVRMGLNGAQLVLVDHAGEWTRWVFSSVEAAAQAAGRLGVAVHRDAFPSHLRMVMTERRRPSSDYDRGAYAEQGRVGPVNPYPENRPRPRGPVREEEAPGVET